MKLYHVTTWDRAHFGILVEGFRDSAPARWQGEGESPYYSAVWFCTNPFEPQVSGVVDGDTVLVVEVPEEVATKYEVVTQGQAGPPLPAATPSYREFLIPAEIVNSHGPAHLLVDGDWPPC